MKMAKGFIALEFTPRELGHLRSIMVFVMNSDKAAKADRQYARDFLDATEGYDI